MSRPVPLIVIGVLGIAAAVVLGAVVPTNHQLAVMIPGCLLACAFAWGVGKLADPWLVLPALMVLVPGTAVLVGDGHRALMDVLAQRETCVVERVDEVTGHDNPAYSHRVHCPDGTALTVVVQGNVDKQLPLGPVTVLRHEHMRPLLADRNDWSVGWVLGVPITIFVLLICATGLRARRVMRQA
ncbi:hypothetical protein BBK82_19130 [Lentzea guizhouensis]|uniref:Uncharacterized protein n=1 Tax=Lentzea guizhouensis TaxID=1586287 RepID=A0A1B2HJH3_9PSEU|nr:hypothetical protein [Lentzea guizhouensis]ANZ37861.1 hypothetical protein BBK82_19130 [Lentzea guizhouensis]